MNHKHLAAMLATVVLLSIAARASLIRRLPGSSPPLSAQSPGCNNTTRESDIVAGDHNMSETTCQQLTFSVAGQSYSTPAKCLRGGAHYSETVYKCNGPLLNWNCNPKGHQVPVTTYTDGACPQMPQLNVLSWDSWKKVPEELAKAMTCTPPKKHEDKDWSATLKACGTSTEPDPTALVSGQTYVGSDNQTFLAWMGAWTDQQAQPWAGPDFLTAYDLAQSSSPSVLSGVMHQVAVDHATPPGAQVSATIKIEHFDAEGSSPSNVFTSQVKGSITADGHFDLTRSIATTDEAGNPDVLVHHTTRDGMALRDLFQGGDAGCAFSGTYPHKDRALATNCADVRPIFWWLYDPFELPLFDGVQFVESSGTQAGEILARRMVGEGASSYIGTEYAVDTSGTVTHPLRHTVYDSSGHVREETLFENDYAIGGSVWRPATSRTTTYLDGTTAGPRIIVTVTITRASLLTAAQASAVPAAFPDTQMWEVWL
jgi:hypothetical protein